MAMNVTISQRLFGNKMMPLEVILGSELYYGCLESDHLQVGERDEKEIIVYDPGCIGIGFSVVWNPGERCCGLPCGRWTWSGMKRSAFWRQLQPLASGCMKSRRWMCIMRLCRCIEARAVPWGCLSAWMSAPRYTLISPPFRSA